jgi:hypothetical protein
VGCVLKKFHDFWLISDGFCTDIVRAGTVSVKKLSSGGGIVGGAGEREFLRITGAKALMPAKPAGILARCFPIL